MSTEQLFLVDPYNDEQLEMIQTFEKEQGFNQSISQSIRQIRSSVPQEEFLQRKKNNNEIEEDLFIIKDSKITDYCHIQGEKDIKTGKIIPLLDGKRKIVSLAADYALDFLGLEEVFVMTNSNNTGLMHYLETKGFESLGEEEGKIIYLKEKSETQENQRMIA